MANNRWNEWSRSTRTDESADLFFGYIVILAERDLGQVATPPKKPRTRTLTSTAAGGLTGGFFVACPGVPAWRLMAQPCPTVAPQRRVKAGTIDASCIISDACGRRAEAATAVLESPGNPQMRDLLNPRPV